MSCQWTPETNVQISLPGTEELAIGMVIKAMDMLNIGVMRVLLVPEDPSQMFSCCPGQYLSLISPAHADRVKDIATLQGVQQFTDVTRDEKTVLLYVYSDRHPGAYYLFDKHVTRGIVWGRWGGDGRSTVTVQ